MKKHEVDHVLRAAGGITGRKRFLIIGSQSLHGSHPDVADLLLPSIEVDLIAWDHPDLTDLLNEIGVDSPFHRQYGYYADPVDAETATLPRSWQLRLVPLEPGDTGGVVAQCLDPHDLAIAKYVARREKDRIFTREMARRGLVGRDFLLTLLDETEVTTDVRERIRADIADDFDASRPP